MERLKIIALILGISIIGGFSIELIKSSYSSSPKKNHSDYKGISISSEWDPMAICRTARNVIKDRLDNTKQKSIYHSKCEVIKLTAPLFGPYSHYEPYATKWSNNVAARVFITNSNKLKVMGISESGVPTSWFKEEQ